MPVLSITHDQGAAPVLAPSNQRTLLVLQNNSGRDMRYRMFGEVSLSDPAKRGLLLRANGGSITLSGALAARPLYAVHGAGAGITETLDYEADA
jgi:hypothetical protein